MKDVEQLIIQREIIRQVMAEKRNMMIYPFITFWKIIFRQYFGLTIAVFLILVLLVGVFGAGFGGNLVESGKSLDYLWRLVYGK